MKIQADDYNLVSFLWPDYKWVFYPYSPFIQEKKLIVVCNNDLDLYPDKTCIYLTKHSGVKVDSKAGMVETLGQRWALDEKLKDTLLSMEEGEFWPAVKYFWLMGTLPSGTLTSEGSSSIFYLFKSLFQSFPESYRLYRTMGRPYQVVFSSLLSMMLKTKAEFVDGSDYYRKVLRENRTYYAHFRKCVVEYIESELKEVDFISFLFHCSCRG